MNAPLADPTYAPAHPPVDGCVPDVVAKWGAASQLRWFDRFRSRLKPMPASEWARFHCSSVQHCGSCCASCLDDLDAGYVDWGRPADYLHPVDDERCCCIVLKEQS